MIPLLANYGINLKVILVVTHLTVTFVLVYSFGKNVLFLRDPHLAVFIAYSWHRALDSLLAVLRVPYIVPGIEPGSASYKTGPYLLYILSGP